MIGSPQQIGIAVVESQGGFLVGTRGEGGPLAGYAEFPGGKCHPDEPSAKCACRECFEETGLQVRSVQLLLNTTHQYNHGIVDLHFWLCHPEVGSMSALPHGSFNWVRRARLKELKFPDGNLKLIELLTAAEPLENDSQ